MKLNNAEERRLLVKNELERLNVTRVADLGCGEGAFIRYLTNGKSYGLIVGIDISAEELKKAEKEVKPGLYDVSFMSNTPQSVLLFKGDLLDLSVYSVFDGLDIEAVTLIEVIQHVQRQNATPMMRLIFEKIRARVVIVTTPNSDFNKFFGLAQDELRHWDHKYEFSQKEFEEWATDIAKYYGYQVSFSGTHFEVEEHPEAFQEICSQVAIFVMEEECPSKQSSLSSLTTQSERKPPRVKDLEISVTSAQPLIEITYPYLVGSRRVQAEVIRYQSSWSQELRSLEVPDSFYEISDEEEEEPSLK